MSIPSKRDKQELQLRIQRLLPEINAAAVQRQLGLGPTTLHNYAQRGQISNANYEIVKSWADEYEDRVVSLPLVAPSELLAREMDGIAAVLRNPIYDDGFKVGEFTRWVRRIHGDLEFIQSRLNK